MKDQIKQLVSEAIEPPFGSGEAPLHPLVKEAMIERIASAIVSLPPMQTVPPEARAVEAAKILTAQLALPPDKRDWNEVHRAALSLRTVNPPGEGVEWARTAVHEIIDLMCARDPRHISDRPEDLEAIITQHAAGIQQIGTYGKVRALCAAARDTAVTLVDAQKGPNNVMRVEGPQRLKDKLNAIMELLPEHAPRPTAARECGASEAAVKDLCEMAHRFLRGPGKDAPEGSFGENMEAILTKHGLGVSEDTQRLDWLVAISPEANVYIRKVIGQREESLYGWRTSRLRELIDAARSANQGKPDAIP